MQAKESLQTKRSADEMRFLLEDQSRSGLTVKAFCKERGIKEAGFYYWQQKFRREKGGKVVSRGFQEIALDEGSNHKDRFVFAEYKGILFYQEPSASLLKQLIG